MSASPHLGLDLMQLGAHLLLAREPAELEPPAPVLRTYVREAQEIERLRLGVAAAGSTLGGDPPKLDQPRLALVQLQTKARDPFAKLSPEPLGVVTMLEAHHEVVREPHRDDVAASVPRTPLVDPQDHPVVKVDVREQRRNRRPLRRSL